MSDVSGFQRRRRIVSAQEDNAAANERINELNDVEEFGNGEGNPTNDDNTDKNFVTDTNMDATVLLEAQVDNMTLEELQAELTKREIQFPHNAGEKNLKGKLKDAIKGS